MIKVYSKTDCPYCSLAKQWLDERKLEYQTIVLDDYDARQRFYDENKISSRTVPQIYLNEERIGGYTDLLQSKLAVTRINSTDF